MMFVLGLVSCLCFLGVLWWNLNGICFEIQEIQKGTGKLQYGKILPDCTFRMVVRYVA
jgi:hypothetical protein